MSRDILDEPHVTAAALRSDERALDHATQRCVRALVDLARAITQKAEDLDHGCQTVPDGFYQRFSDDLADCLASIDRVIDQAHEMMLLGGVP